MTGQLSALAQGKAAGTTGYTSKLLKTGQTTQRDSELDDGYYEAGVERSYTVNTAGQYSGTTNIDFAWVSANTAVSFDSGSKEIRGTGLFTVFTTGETVVVSGSVSNNGVFTTKATVSADKLTVNEAITDESAGAAVTIKKREAVSNNTVLDNNTGLMWMRYAILKLGYAGDGRLQRANAYDIVAACNTASLSGYTDWRMPNVNELFSLVTYRDATNCVPDTTAFPSFVTGYYFHTSTRDPAVANNNMTIKFLGGDVEWNGTTNWCYLICVRGGLA